MTSYAETILSAPGVLLPTAFASLDVRSIASANKQVDRYPAELRVSQWKRRVNSLFGHTHRQKFVARQQHLAVGTYIFTLLLAFKVTFGDCLAAFDLEIHQAIVHLLFTRVCIQEGPTFRVRRIIPWSFAVLPRRAMTDRLLRRSVVDRRRLHVCWLRLLLRSCGLSSFCCRRRALTGALTCPLSFLWGSILSAWSSITRWIGVLVAWSRFSSRRSLLFSGVNCRGEHCRQLAISRTTSSKLGLQAWRIVALTILLKRSCFLEPSGCVFEVLLHPVDPESHTAVSAMSDSMRNELVKDLACSSVMVTLPELVVSGR